MALTIPTLESLKPQAKAYVVTDKEGLYVEVLPTGSIIWRYRFRVAGRREKLTLGKYPALSLKKARAKHAELRALVAQGRNPAREKQNAKREDASAETFRDFATPG